ncbi:MAG: ABC transporter substrate-binding protein, partial [Myxococcales bacterium]
GLKSEDISLIHLPPADLVTAFASGHIAAAATWEPFLSRIEVNGARRIVDGTGIKQGALVIFAVDEFAQKNADLVEKLLNAYQRGAEYIKANPKEAAALIAPEVRLDPDQVERLFPIFNYDPVVRSEHIAELKATEEFLRTNGLSKERVNIDSFTDSRYLLRAGIR